MEAPGPGAPPPPPSDTPQSKPPPTSEPPPTQPEDPPEDPPDDPPEQPEEPEPPPVLTTCAPEPEGDTGLPESERKARHDYACTGIALEGTVVSTSGSAVANATVRLGDATTRTDTAGRFRFPVLPRHNALLQVEAERFRSTRVAVELRRSLSETKVKLLPLRLSPKDGGVRMLFGGDVSLGRRFLDPDGSTPRDQLPPDDPNALIRVSDPLPGTKSVFTWVRPFFQEADFRAVNLETPVTDSPGTPHGTKAYAFFTLPGSLPALPWLGVDYVSMGNNHVYDYLAPGLEDTLQNVAATGMAFSGAGRNEAEAFHPARVSLGGTSYSLVSMCGVTGDAHETQYVAGPTQGGAANLRDDARVSATLGGERAAGQVPVAVLHAGVEYSERPEGTAGNRMRYVIDQGAALVIAHHPHTPQGFARYKGVLVAQSLGNLAFDQERLETMVSQLAEVEMRGATVSRARSVPVYLEDYRPRPIAGELAENMLRHLAELSREGGVELVPGPSSGELLPEGQHAVVTERTVSVPVTVDAAGRATVDLRPWRHEGESMAVAEVVDSSGQHTGGAHLEAGRDILRHGDFEDHDVDDDANEAARWKRDGGGSFVCQDAPHRGAAALCLRRASTDRKEAVVELDNRFRLPGYAEGSPTRNLTMVAWVKADGAGPGRVLVQYLPIEYYTLFGEQELLRHEGGTFGWTFMSTDLNLPPEPQDPDIYDAPWALDLSIRGAPPKKGQGQVAVDDLALVAWERDADGGTLRLETPHARDFVRVKAPAGTYTLRVTFREHRVP